MAGPVQDLLETLEELQLFLTRRRGFFIVIQIDHRRWTRIDVGEIFVACFVIMERFLILPQGEGGDAAPLWTKEGRVFSVRSAVAGLVDECSE